MSIQDETWDRPQCNICCTEIKYGEKHKHGAGRCDSDSAHSKLGRYTGLQCPHCYQMVKYEDKEKHADGKCNELCPNCNGPVHPCLPCEEAVMLNGNHADYEYFQLLRDILDNGRVKKNRTGVNTIGVFGRQAKFDVRMDAFPILTTKKVWFKGIVHELLWFIKGDTNIKYLVDNDVHIWDEWAYKRYNDACGAEDCQNQQQFIERLKSLPADDHWVYNWGDLGEGTYGGMWRAFPYARRGNVGEFMIMEDSVDQIAKVIEKLKTNPDDRRMIVSAWHPYWVDHCALPPCHCFMIFNTEELTFEERLEIVKQRNPGVSSFEGRGGIGSLEVVAKEEGWLDGAFYQPSVPKRKLNLLMQIRSNDMFLGAPFNISSYSLLIAMVAHCVNMVPGVLTYTIGDAHIYVNHLEQVELQLSRTPKVLPSLWINPEKRDLFSLKYEDIRLDGYNPHPAIKGEVAV